MSGLLKSVFVAQEAINNAKSLTIEELFSKVEANNLHDYGFYSTKTLIQIWKEAIVEAKEEGKELRIAAALNNNDYEGVLLSILKDNMVSVIEGMAIASYALETKAVIIYLPNEDKELENKLVDIAVGYGLTIEFNYEIVDMHVTKSNPYYNVNSHFETYAALSNFFANEKDYVGTIVLAIKYNDQISELVEVPFGKKVEELIGEIDKEEIKAIFIGSVMYDSSGLAIVIDEKNQPNNGIITIIGKATCIVDLTANKLEQVCYKSCGKCTFCRDGSRQLHTIMTEVIHGQGNVGDFVIFQEICDAMNFSTLCSIGKSGADSAIGAFKYFNEEIEDHVKRKRCATDTCKAFMNIYIDPMKCEGCGDCVDVCPVDCIEGDDGYIHMIDDMECTKCGKCIDACEVGAIIRATGRLPKLPDKLTKVGKFKKR